MGLLADIFGRKDVAPAPAPEPSLTDAERSASLREQLHDVQTRMGELNVSMRDFRTQHQLRVDGLCQVTGMKSESLGGWKEIERTWRGYLIRRDSLMREFARVQAQGSIYWARHE